MANKAIYQRVVQDATGAIVPSAQYEVFDEGSGLNATIYSDRAGTTTITQPAFADTSGIIQFFIDPGVTFRAEVTGGSGAYNDRYQQGLLLTESATDTDTDRTTKVGDFGWGGYSGDHSGDLNDLVVPQTSGVSSAAANNPTAYYGDIIVTASSASEGAQIFASRNSPTNEVWTRKRNGSTWSSWQELYHTGNLNTLQNKGASVLLTGTVRNSTQAIFPLQLDLFATPAGISVASTFNMQGYALGANLATGIVAGDISIASTSQKEMIILVSNLSGLTPNDTVYLFGETSSSEITVVP